MIKPRCPDPELLGLLLENRLRKRARARILQHAADCVPCRRQLAIASLSPIGPLRAALEQHLRSGRLTLSAGLILGLIVLGFWTARLDPEVLGGRAPTSSTGVRAGAREGREGTAHPLTARPSNLPSGAETAPSSVLELASGPGRDGPFEARESTAAAAAPEDPTQVMPPLPGIPRHLDQVAQSSHLPAAEPKAADVETIGRLAILDPFGSLTLEGAGGRTPVQSSRVMAVEARLTAVGRASGFRLGDGLRVQLSPGSSVSVFQNVTRRCAGLAVLQGALLVESSQAQSLYLRRDASSGILEGMNGQVLVSSGTRADAMTVMPLGTGGAVWKRGGLPPQQIAAGDTLGIDANGQDLSGKGGRQKPLLARFVSWPEPSSLFYSSFEDDIPGMEQPVIVQGITREGHVTAAAGAKGRKTIEITLPSSLQTLPSDATLRLRVRTTAARIQCAIGMNSGRTVPLTVAQRNRSETMWITVSIALIAFDQDGHRGRGGNGGRQGLRGNVTFIAEPPSRVSAEDLVFDIDEMEITRS